LAFQEFMNKGEIIMKVNVYQTSLELGKEAAAFSAAVLNEAIAKNAKARLILSTGASQFDTLAALINQEVDWNKVEMFHLDEYVNLPETHLASFRKYLQERFTSKVKLKNAFFVNGEGNVQANIKELTSLIRKEPIDLALVGIGENAHIAFNDPPADFNTKEAYIVVNLDDNCKKQQVREGWFASVADVPKQAISMTVFQIMESKVIVSAVPKQVKANAIKLTLENDVTPMIPATKLKDHPNVHVFVDQDSASTVKPELLNRFK
jgi:glucosamine-6-phosphate deaminase